MQHFRAALVSKRARLTAIAGVIALSGGAFAAHPAAASDVISLATKTFNCNLTSACLSTANTGTGAAFTANSTSGQAVIGSSKTGIGVVGGTQGASYGVFGAASGPKAGTAVYADDASFNGYGLFAISGTGTAGFIQNAATNANPTLIVKAGITGMNNAIVETFDSSGTGLEAMYDNGNMGITGLMFTGGTCGGGCSKTHREVTYAAQESQPVTEDSGEAQLNAGSAFVKLDAAFANVIDRTKPYVVTLTPEGDTRGLFVAQRTAGGFTVRETQAGRSNIAFAYRITANPYGVNAARLPMVDFGTAPR